MLSLSERLKDEGANLKSSVTVNVGMYEVTGHPHPRL